MTIKKPFIEESLYKGKIFLPERHGFKLYLDFASQVFVWKYSSNYMRTSPLFTVLFCGLIWGHKSDIKMLICSLNYLDVYASPILMSPVNVTYSLMFFSAAVTLLKILNFYLLNDRYEWSVKWNRCMIHTSGRKKKSDQNKRVSPNQIHDDYWQDMHM